MHINSLARAVTLDRARARARTKFNHHTRSIDLARARVRGDAADDRQRVIVVVPKSSVRTASDDALCRGATVRDRGVRASRTRAAHFGPSDDVARARVRRVRRVRCGGHGEARNAELAPAHANVTVRRAKRAARDA